MVYYAGLMSGTSMDGIDAVIINEQNELISGHTFDYSKKTNQQLSQVVKDKHADLSVIGTLHRQISIEYASAYKQLLKMNKMCSTQIRAVGCHGQTISHQTFNKPFYTYQLGCPSTLATETSTTVVADFRSMDIALGGHGAPLAPLYHDYCFSKLSDRLAIVNIGGIANLSILIDEHLTAGYDIGPGNCLLNGWIKLNQGHDFDEQGNWAASGKVDETLLRKLLSDPYFQLSGPKSIDREYFSIEWLKSYFQAELMPEDVQATLLELTAITITDQVKKFPPVKTLILCGGGANNTLLNTRIRYYLKETVVNPSSHFGINENYLEAMMMAWLGWQRLDQRTFELSTITGNPYPTMLGHVFYPLRKDTKSILLRK